MKEANKPFLSSSTAIALQVGFDIMVGGGMKGEIIRVCVELPQLSRETMLYSLLKMKNLSYCLLKVRQIMK